MTRTWTPEQLMELSRGYQGACLLAAAVDWDLFTLLAGKPMTAAAVAQTLRTDERATAALLDALEALGLLEKAGGEYRTLPGVADVLARGGTHSQLAMAQHQGNCLRNWAQLSGVIRTGKPAACGPSVRGKDADNASFIEAMNDISGPVADGVVGSLPRLEFTHLLDVGGGSGTWTAAFLRAYPQARATLFDLVHVIPLARRRLGELGLLDRVALVPGDFYKDPLPVDSGADLAWVSAIVHQNSRAQNRDLFAKVSKALVQGGQIAIRDMVMDESRTRPVAGALFAINMLVATPQGGTFTLGELREDLEATAFEDVRLARKDEGMHAVVMARKK